MKDVMKKFLFTGILSLLFLGSVSVMAQPGGKLTDGWLLGAQTYSFRAFTFAETLDRMQKLGLSNAEVYFGQKLGGNLNGVMDYRMDAATQLKVREMAESKGVHLYACGVVVCNSNQEWDELFGFVRTMGIRMVTCEPTAEQLPYVEKLAEAAHADIAIHNHPKPSAYWDPSILASVLKKASAGVGSCADVGHWKRMGIDPVGALSMLNGRIKCLHLKDVTEARPESPDTVWGQGVCQVEAILQEMARQHFKGLISIEYESDEKNPDPAIRQCIQYYREKTSKL